MQKKTYFRNYNSNIPILSFFEPLMYDACKCTFSYNISPPTNNIIDSKTMQVQRDFDPLKKNVKCLPH